jgi:iron complex outermembrane receptor protein
MGSKRGRWTLVFIVQLVSTASVLRGQQLGSIRGTVVDRQSRAALANVTLRLQGTSLSTQSSAEGVFAFQAVPPGTRTLTATLIGYSPATASVVVRSGETSTLELGMQAAPSTLSELVVTATKAPTEIRDVPAPVEVVSSATIAQSGAKTLMQAVQNATGVTEASFGENFQSIQLRGLPRLGNENETVLILVDGVPQTDARNSAQLITLPVDMIDQIEVVRGPNSALYGRTAVGGVVNILTRNPGPEHAFGAHLETGAFGYIRGSASAGGPAGSQSGYYVSWLGDRHQGFQSPAISRRLSSLFGKFTTSPDARTHLTVTGNYVTNEGGTPAPIPIIGGELLSEADPNFSRYTNLNLPFARYDQSNVRAMGKIARDLSGTVNLTNTFGYRHDKYNFFDDGDVLSPPAAGATDVILFPFTHQREENAYFDDLHLEATLGPQELSQRLIGGVSFERNTGARSSLLPFSDSTTGGVLVDYLHPVYPSEYDLVALDIGGSSYSTTFYGIYAQDEITVRQRLHFSLGARYDINDLRSVPLAPATGDPVEGTFKKLSPKVGVSYRVLDGARAGAPQLSAYAQYSRAFLPPIAAIDPQAVRTSPPSPEDITNYEAGVKGTVLDGRLDFDASAFYLKRDGIPIQVRTGGNTFEITNGGIQKFPGFEIALNGRATPEVSLWVRYAYYGAKFGDFRFVQNGSDVDYTNNRISLAPRHVLDVGTNIASRIGLGVFLNGHYEGARYLNAANTFLLGSYFLTDGRVSWAWRNYTTALAVRNVFNQRYEIDGDLSTAQFAFPGSRRVIVLELGAEF